MWYLLAAALFFLPLRRSIALGLLALTVVFAVINGTLQLAGIVVLVMLGAVAIWRSQQKPATALAVPAEMMLVAGAIALMLHLVPGINNALVVSDVKVGPQSAPFSFWYNFDKAVVPFLLLGCIPTLLKRPASPPANRLWWLVLLLSMPILLLVATLAGGLDVELHLPEWLGAFMLANLFFVSFAEEALFRGYIQQRLSQVIGARWGLLVAALLFGLAHAGGGAMLVGFAMLAGIIYGLAWLWSGRLWVSTLVHFAFNMLHLLFFTYPVWQPLPG